MQKNLENFLYFGSRNVYYAPQDGQKFRCSENFSHWDAPPLGYFNVEVESGGDKSVPVFSIAHDKGGKEDTTWYSFKQNGNSFPVASDQPNNRCGTGKQKICVGTESLVPSGLQGSDTYRLTVLWSRYPRRADHPPAQVPDGAILMTTTVVSYLPLHGQKFRCSNNFSNWNPKKGDVLFFAIDLLEEHEIYPSFAVVHDKSGKDRIWYDGVTDGSIFHVNAQSGGAGKQKIYVGTQSPLSSGVAPSDVYRVNVYRLPKRI